MRCLFGTFLLGIILIIAACEDSDSSNNTQPPVSSDTLWTWDKFYAQAETTEVNSRSALVDSFIAYWQPIAIPPVYLPEDSSFGTAVFLYRSTANSAQVVGDFDSWSALPENNMQRLNGTTLFYLVKRFESDARFDYKIIVNGSNWILDPLNPRTQWIWTELGDVDAVVS
jgi:hypothetical protein